MLGKRHFLFTWVDKNKHISSQIIVQKSLPHLIISYVWCHCDLAIMTKCFTLGKK